MTLLANSLESIELSHDIPRPWLEAGEDVEKDEAQCDHIGVTLGLPGV